jgi:hypothetical protein
MPQSPTSYTDADKKIILKWILEKGCRVMSWIHLAHDKGHWWDLVNTIMEPYIQQNAWNLSD